MPFATKGAMYETPAEGVIKGSASDLGLYDIKVGQAFVQVTFKALTFTGDTVVDLFVEDLTVSERNAEGKLDEEKQETLVVNGQATQTETPVALDTVITPGPATPVEPETTVPATEPETTVPATEPETTVPATEPETTVPATEPETTAPVEPETTAPVEPETTAPATEAPTDAPSTDATGATGATVNPGTADTPTGGTTSNGSAVQTGNASMAVIILLVLVSACGVLYFTRKRVK